MHTTQTDQTDLALPTVFPTLHLLFSGGNGVVGRVFVLSRGATDIGREAGADAGVSLKRDERASRLHARVVVGAQVQRGRRLVHPARIEDLGSKNGTYVNGARVTTCELCDGDVIRVGNSFLLLREEPARQPDAEVPSLVGRSVGVRALRSQLRAAAERSEPVLLLGESGVGKDVAAQALHRLTGAAQGRRGALVAVNCAAIPASLAESQLFGHESGAFSGATRAQSGFFRAASEGTLFLDEIGELPLDLQPKLLRALEEGLVTPVGATRPVACSVRVVAATNRDLRQAVHKGAFRGDLYARLTGTVVALVPLRERREDVLPLLAAALAQQGLPVPRLSARLVEALLLYRWPYNVRELMKMATALGAHARTEPELDLPLVAARFEPEPAEPGAPGPDAPVAQRPSSAETPPGADAALASDDEGVAEKAGTGPRLSREALERLYQEHGGNISKLARLAGRSRRQVRRWLEQYGLQARKPDDT